MPQMPQPAINAYLAIIGAVNEAIKTIGKRMVLSANTSVA